jgi:flagellin
MLGDSATGMITFNAQHATDFSSMIENTPLSLTSTLMASPKSMSDVSYPASAAVGTNTTNAFTASANNTDTTVVIDGNTFTSTAAVAKSISDVSYPTSGNSAVGTDTTNAFKASAVDLSTSIEIGGTTFTTHVVNSDTFKGETGGTNIKDGAAGSSKETQSFNAILPNVAARIEIDGIQIETTGNASAMSVIDLNKNLALQINEDPRMIERGVTATVNSAGDEVTIAYAKEAMSVAAINTHLASQINASSAMAAIGVKANAATVAGEVTLTFNVPDTSVSALNADLAAKINASAEMQTLGIKADTTTASGEVTLAFGVNGKPHRDATAAGFAARINNDPSFLAKGILAVAQTDAAVLGSTANRGGTAQSLVFTGTSSMAGARFEIKGTDANGIPMTEMVIGTGTSNKTVQDFLTVETITQIGDTDVASNISIGTASDADGILDATDTAAGLINFGTNATNVMVNARVELLHGADDMSTAAKARHAVSVLDGAIKSVNTQRSNLGAVSNRLSHTVSNLTNISSNLSAAKGGIEDADFALETTALAKNQILQQASTAMLAQANAAKQNVLSLLQG